MQVRIKKLHPNAVIPTYAKPGDAGLDLTAVDYEFFENDRIVYYTGLAIEIPEGYVGLIFQRSSVRNKDIILSNCVGVIDSGYRGEITFTFRTIVNYVKLHPLSDSIYKIGDRIGQIVIMPYPQIELVEAEELSETHRGKSGFGSSGR